MSITKKQMVAKTVEIEKNRVSSLSPKIQDGAKRQRSINCLSCSCDQLLEMKREIEEEKEKLEEELELVEGLIKTRLALKARKRRKTNQEKENLENGEDTL